MTGAGSRSFGLVPARAIAPVTARSTNGERRWAGAVGPLEWGVGNRAYQRNRRGEGNVVRAPHALEARCPREANDGLPGTGRCLVPKGGEFACQNALGRLRCAM